MESLCNGLSEKSQDLVCRLKPVHTLNPSRKLRQGNLKFQANLGGHSETISKRERRDRGREKERGGKEKEKEIMKTEV